MSINNNNNTRVDENLIFHFSVGNVDKQLNYHTAEKYKFATKLFLYTRFNKSFQ